MTITAQPLTVEAFCEFGRLITEPNAEPTATKGRLRYWHDIQKAEFAAEITVAYVSVGAQPLTVVEMERHQSSPVIFIPVAGVAVMVFAPPVEDVGTEGPSMPDVKRARAFHVSPSPPFLISPDTWYSMALSREGAQFVCIASADIMVAVEFHALDLTVHVRA